MNNNLKPNLRYFQDCLLEINGYIKDGYNLIGGDVGLKNLILLQDLKLNSIRYTYMMYRVESKKKKHNDVMYELENKRSQNILTDEEKIKYKKINDYINFSTDQSFKKFYNRIVEKYGKNIILCIGDTGYNVNNMMLVMYLSKYIPCYLIDERNTSKICNNCNSIVEHVKKNETDIRSIRLVICTSCNTIYNKDVNACMNMLNNAYVLINSYK